MKEDQRQILALQGIFLSQFLVLEALEKRGLQVIVLIQAIFELHYELL